MARLVDLPTPLTPQKVMTKGLRWERASITSRRMSTRRLGCRICTRESCRACFTVEATAAQTHTDTNTHGLDVQYTHTHINGFTVEATAKTRDKHVGYTETHKNTCKYTHNTAWFTA